MTKLFITKEHRFWFLYSTITSIGGIVLIISGDIQLAIWLQLQFLITASVCILCLMHSPKTLTFNATAPIIPNPEEKELEVIVEYGHAHGDARSQMRISTDKGTDAN